MKILYKNKERASWEGMSFLIGYKTRNELLFEYKTKLEIVQERK
jgi:hypothetical protein